MAPSFNVFLQKQATAQIASSTERCIAADKSITRATEKIILSEQAIARSRAQLARVIAGSTLVVSSPRLVSHARGLAVDLDQRKVSANLVLE